MAISFSRPDPSSPAAVAAANFTMARRGFDPDEVHEFLRMVAAELARLQERERFLERELRSGQHTLSPQALSVDEDVVTRLLGEEAARILTTSREAAAQIKSRAEENAARLLREATDEAQRVREEADIEAARRRQDSASDAEAELQMAKQQGREMVNEARAYRERVLGELARRRELARQQIESLVHGRDRLLQAFERARVAAVDVMAELTPLTEPQELAIVAPTAGPTTGPVPIIEPAPAAADEVVADELAVMADVVQMIDEVVDSVEGMDTATHTAAGDAADVVETAHVVPTVEATERPRRRRDTVVLLPDTRADDADADDAPDRRPGRGHIAPVVSLFAGEVAVPGRPQPPAPPQAPYVGSDHPAVVAAEEAANSESANPEPAEPVSAAAPADDVRVRNSVDDLFARLRAARAGAVAERVLADAQPDTSPPVATAVVDEVADEVADDASGDTPFARRDAELVPLIVTAARKLKRVLADEQNDVLHVLRGKQPVSTLAALLPDAGEHAHRYGQAVRDELVHAALAGAASIDDGAALDHQRAIDAHDALRPALEMLTESVIAPLRDRLDRAVTGASGDNGALLDAVRAVYREWKTHRIDEHLDDVVRMAFGRGAYVVLAPGTRICWTVDPNGPDCADAEDNTLGGVVRAGEPFPTDHVCAPAHEGCRCMVQLAPR